LKGLVIQTGRDNASIEILKEQNQLSKLFKLCIALIFDLLTALMFSNKHVQWTPFKGIMDNGILRLMESNVSRFTSPKLL
jgi:hypothetical protein